MIIKNSNLSAHWTHFDHLSLPSVTPDPWLTYTKTLCKLDQGAFSRDTAPKVSGLVRSQYLLANLKKAFLPQVEQLHMGIWTQAEFKFPGVLLSGSRWAGQTLTSHGLGYTVRNCKQPNFLGSYKSYPSQWCPCSLMGLDLTIRSRASLCWAYGV